MTIGNRYYRWAVVLGIVVVTACLAAGFMLDSTWTLRRTADAPWTVAQLLRSAGLIGLSYWLIAAAVLFAVVVGVGRRSRFGVAALIGALVFSATPLGRLLSGNYLTAGLDTPPRAAEFIVAVVVTIALPALITLLYFVAGAAIRPTTEGSETHTGSYPEHSPT